MEKRKNKDGKFVYRESVWIHGTQKKTKWYSRKTDARKEKNELVRLRDKGYGETLFDAITFGEFSTKWLNEEVFARTTISTSKEYERILNSYILPIFNHLDLSKIRLEHGLKLVSVLKKNGHNPGGINKIIGVLKACLNSALKRGHLRINPLLNLTPLKKDNDDYPIMDKSKVQRLLALTKNHYLHAYWFTALYTGARRGELAGLGVQHIDIHNNTIRISRIRDRYGLRDTTKSKKVRVIPIHPELREVLIETLNKPRSCDLLFVKPSGEPISVHHIYRDWREAQN
jgi:integrase